MDQAGVSTVSSAERASLPVRERVARLPGPRVPQLSVVIINYGDWQGTASLARQVLRSAAGRRGLAEVVVVDNHSPPDRIIPRLRRWPGLSLRRWQANHGFARAANEGCRLSSAGWVLLLNPDVTLPAELLSGVLELTEWLTSHEPRTGVVGFRLHNSDGSPQCSAGPWPTLPGLLLGLARPRQRRRCRPIDVPGLQSVPWVTGCCMLLRKECLRELGGFDPGFFLYYEDVDLCRRARAAGWSVCYEPRLWATHHRPLHDRQVRSHLRLITRHALLTYAAKHWPAWQTKALGLIIRLEARLRHWWARRQGKCTAAATFADLEQIAQDVTGGRQRRGWRRLLRTVRQAQETESATSGAHSASKGEPQRPPLLALRAPDQPPNP